MHVRLKELGASHTHEDEKFGVIFPEDHHHHMVHTFYSVRKIPQLQHRLQQQLHNQRHATLIAECSVSDRARLRACKQPGARSLLVKSPCKNRFALTEVELSVAWRMALGLMPCPRQSLPSICVCGAVVHNKPVDHLLTCHKAVGDGLVHSHNLCRDALAWCAARAGYKVTKEPRFGAVFGGLRPDLLLIDNNGKSILVDVSLTVPTSKSVHQRAANTDLGAATKREVEKKRKYNSMALTLGAVFCPFVIERTCGFGKEAINLIVEMAYQAAQFSLHVSAGDPTPLGMIWTRMSHAVHRSNALLVKRVLQHHTEFRLKQVDQLMSGAGGSGSGGGDLFV